MIIEHDEVKLLPYDPLWKTEFEAAQAGLSQTLNAKRLHPQIIHVGSTAIVDMPAKPIIDILILFSDEQAVSDCVSALIEKGITFLGDGGRQGRYFLVDETGAFPHHLHVTTEDNQVAKDQLLFKSLLQGSDKIMQDYISIKLQAADAYPNDRTMYRYMKGSFIDAVLRAYELGVQSNDCKAHAKIRSRQQMNSDDFQVPKFLESEELPAGYYDPVDPYSDPPKSQYNLKALVNYAKEQGKNVVELSKEEVKPFKI